MAASLELPKGIKPLQPVPTITRYFNDADQPYTDLTQVLSENPPAARHIGLVVNVQGVEYQFKNGIEDENLVRYIDEATEGIYKGNVLIEGGFVNTPGTYEYPTWAQKYVINNNLYSNYISETVVLNPADETFDRIDVIVINANQTISAIEGTPAADPVKPNLDSETQLEVTFILVKANTTAPSDVVTTVVYNENAQQPTEANTLTDSPARVTFDNTEEASAGTLSTKFAASNNFDNAKYKLATAFFRTDYDVLSFDVKIKNTMKHQVKVIFSKVATGATAAPIGVMLQNGAYGFDTSNISTWQRIIIPLKDFNLGAASYDEIVFENKANTATFHIDNIFLQKNGGTLTPPIIEKTSDIPVNDGATGISPYLEERVYNDIPEMLSNQASQLESFNIIVNDASADTNLTFPTGANKVAYYKYNGVATGSINDYTLVSAPYGIVVNTDRRITTSSNITQADFGKTIYVSGTAIELAIDVSVNMLNDSFKCFFHNLNAVDTITFTFEPVAGWTFPTSLTLYAGEVCALVRVKNEPILKLLGNE